MSKFIQQVTWLAAICGSLLVVSCKSTAETTKSNPQKKPVVVEPKQEEDLSSEITTSFQINGFNSPESVIRHENVFFVSNVGGELLPTKMDGDGYISKLDQAGNLIDQKFIAGLHAPKGMAVHEYILYIADINQVVAYNLVTQMVDKTYDFSLFGTLYLNDITVRSSTQLLVSATDIGKIFTIDVSAPAEEAISELQIYSPLPAGPNGLWYDKDFNKLYIASYGRDDAPNGELGQIDFTSDVPEYQTLHPEYRGYLDGIARVGEHFLLFSDWVSPEPNGVIKLFNIQTGGFEHFKTGIPLAGPADFFYDPKTKNLWIPSMRDGIVYVYPVGDL